MSVEKLDFQKVTKEQTPYTIILNSVIQNISNLEALAIWVYLYSLPQDWAVNKEHLKTKFKLGDNSIKLIFSYLNRANLIAYHRERTEEGKLGESIIHVLCGTSFDANEPYLKTTGSNSAPVVKTIGSKTRRVVFQTSGSGALQKKQDTKEINTTKEILILPAWLSKKDWEDFVQHRRHLKSPLSENAMQRAIKILEALRYKGHDPAKVINQTIVNGWKGFFAIRQVEHTGNGSERPKSASAIHFDTFKHSLKGTPYDPDPFASE